MVDLIQTLPDLKKYLEKAIKLHAEQQDLFHKDEGVTARHPGAYLSLQLLYAACFGRLYEINRDIEVNDA